MNKIQCYILPRNWHFGCMFFRHLREYSSEKSGRKTVRERNLEAVKVWYDVTAWHQKNGNYELFSSVIIS